jgi:hypothetical protein
VRVARYLRNYPWPKYSPCPKQINKKRKNFNNKSSPAPLRKTTAKKKRNLKKFKAKQTEKEAAQRGNFFL